jgi:hypothetical protein
MNDWELGNSVQNNAMLEESGQLCTCSGHKIQVKADTSECSHHELAVYGVAQSW